MSDTVARDQVARAFHLVVQVRRVRMGQRVISEITELEPVHEGTVQRTIPLYLYDEDRQGFYQATRPTNRLIKALARYGQNYDGVPNRL